MGFKLPEELICLNDIDVRKWKGLTVYHPMLQIGKTPYWNTDNYPELHKDEDEDEDGGLVFDKGIVVGFSDKDEHGHVEVTFKTTYNYSLHYSADNIWVAKVG